MIPRRCHPAPLPPKYSKSSRSPASTFPHSTKLLLDCLPLARLVSISPRRDYFQTFAHGKFHYLPTRSNSLSRAGETPWSPDGNSHSTCQDSTQQQTQFTALHSLCTLAFSHARASLFLHPSDFLTPERIFFFTPAIPYARANLILYSSNFLRQSESSSLLQQFLTPERIFFFTPAISYARANLLLFSFRTSEISFVFNVIGGLDDAVTLLPLFFYATIS